MSYMGCTLLHALGGEIIMNKSIFSAEIAVAMTIHTLDLFASLGTALPSLPHLSRLLTLS